MKRVLEFIKSLIWKRELSMREMVKRGEATVTFGNICNDEKSRL